MTTASIRWGKGSGRPGSAPILSALVRAPAISGTTTLSVCCLTRGPTARVAAQLALLRDVADEIVVGLDTSVAADLAHPLAEVADVLDHYPYARPRRPAGRLDPLALHAGVDPLGGRRRDSLGRTRRLGA